MRLKGPGKVVLFLLVIGLAIGGWQLWQRMQPKQGTTVTSGDSSGNTGGSSSGESTPSGGGDASGGGQGLLGRPLRVGVVTWPGYAGGIVANNGFKPNKQCIYWNNHKLLVEFLLMEDVDARAKAFARGGKDGVDIVWSTVDFWANELPGFAKNGVKAKAIMQVDWSRGY